MKANEVFLWDETAGVAQVGNLLHRRLAVGSALTDLVRKNNFTPAGCQPTMQQTASLRCLKH